MKASEIQDLLQKMINLHGDLEVYPDHDGLGFFTHTYPLEHICLGKRNGKKVFEIITGVGA